MSTGSKNIFALLTDEASAHWDTACDALCEGSYISFLSVVIACEEFSCTSHACLYLISDDENILFSAESVYSVNEFLVQLVYTALALNVFHHDSAYRIIQLCFEVVDIVSSYVYESFEEREEVVMENILTGS